MVTIVAGLLLVAVALGIGYLLGNRLLSEGWKDTIRYSGLGLVIVTILSNPLSGLLLWLIMEPYTAFWYLNIRMPAGIPDLSMARLSTALISILLVAQMAGGRRRPRRFGATEFLMVAFAILVMPATVAGLGGLNRSIMIVLDKFLVPFMVFVLAKNLYDKKTGIDKFIGAAVVIGVYLSFMVFYEHLTGQALFYQIGRTTAYSRSLRKIVSLLGNPLFLGTILGMIVPLVLYKLVRSRPGMGRLFYAGVFLATMVASFLCYNRGAWLALGAGLFTMLILGREYRRILIPIVLVALVVGVAYWGAISESAVVTERLTNVGSLRFRVTMLEASAQILREHLIFGVGVDSFAYYFLLYGGHWETMAFDTPTPHNTYILVLVTMGLIAFIPYLLVFLSLMGEMIAGIGRSKRDRAVDGELAVAGLAVIVVYMVAAASADLYASLFTSLVMFTMSGGIVGYLYAERSAAVNEGTAA
jgi:O-antigen ligase